MSFQIRKLVLFGPADEPRVVDLRPGKLNVITGASKSGKSALIHIVDYCLGSRECEVADGPIRDTVDWYALLIEKAGQQMFVARRAPQGSSTSSTEYLIEVGKALQLPAKPTIRATTNREGAVAQLSRFAGIGDYVHEPPQGQTRAAVSPSVHHASFLCFQPQDEIISRKMLFYRQGDTFVERVIRDLLPYFLGAIDDEHLQKTRRLRHLRSEARREAKKLAAADAIAGEGDSVAAALLDEALGVGLVGAPEGPLDRDATLALLRAALTMDRPPVEVVPRSGRYHELVEARDALARELRQEERDLRRARRLVREQQAFTTEAGEQAGRLQTLQLLPGPDSESRCPICESTASDVPRQAELAALLRQVEGQLSTVREENPHLHRLVAELQSSVATLKTRHAEARAAVVAYEESESSLAIYKEQWARAAHVRGRISIFLESVPEESPKLVAVQSRTADIAREIAELEAELDDEVAQERTESLLNLVSLSLTASAKTLRLEHSEHPLRFSLKKLTVLADTPTKTIPMSRMGSGENWVGYHIALHIALHSLFVASGRPVPRFLFLDQPSQVYFPSDADHDGRLEVARDGRDADDDRAAVLRMFKLMQSAVDSLGGQFQIVVTEHADPNAEWFQAAVVERWRGGTKLIPQSWIDAVAGR